MSFMITLVDYGMCNLGSLLNMFKRIGVPAQATAEADMIEKADKLILPGVGAFDSGMRRLAELDLIDLLNDKVLKRKTPVLGVCLGMQLLTTGSEEGSLPGLGWIEGETLRFRFDHLKLASLPDGHLSRLKVPHMGWNTVCAQKSDPLFEGLSNGARFYFVHSYYIQPANAADVIGTTDYGYEFASVVHRDNIWGTQFHPEKSHKFGMRLLKNFAELH